MVQMMSPLRWCKFPLAGVAFALASPVNLRSAEGFEEDFDELPNHFFMILS